MSMEEMQQKLIEYSENKQHSKQEEIEFQKLVAMREQAFGTAFLNVDDPLALQRAWRNE